MRQDNPLDYEFPDLIYLTSDFLVEGFDHPFLIRLTMAHSSESLLVDQIELIKSGLNQSSSLKPESFIILEEGI